MKGVEKVGEESGGGREEWGGSGGGEMGEGREGRGRKEGAVDMGFAAAPQRISGRTS